MNGLAEQILTVGDRRLSFRPVRPGDDDLLARIYASTREEELAPVPWSSAQKAAFVAAQFEAQTHAYRENYPGAVWLVIQVDGADAGRLYVHPRPTELRIMDLALLPAYRDHGYGTAILRALLALPVAATLPVTIHVERFNPALRLYQRLGFQTKAAGEVYLLLEHRPRSA